PIIDDNIYEGNETLNLTLSSPTGGATLGTQTTATLTIVDNDLPTVSLAVSPASVTEDGTINLVYTFTRTGNTANPLTVSFNVGGNATFNNDYAQNGAASFNTTNGTITFVAGSPTATIIVDPTTDTIEEPDENISITLASGTGYTIATSGIVTGAITNDDGILQTAVFNGKTYYLLSHASWADSRTKAISLSGNLVTINDQSENDFVVNTFKDKALNIAPTGKKVALWIGLNDLANEGTFVWSNGEPVSYTNWAVGQPQGGVPDEDFAAIALNIGGIPIGKSHDVVSDERFNDFNFAVVEVPASRLSFSTSNYTVNEDGTPVNTVTINREGNTNGAVSVTINLTNGTATAPSDYNNTPITVNFANGETSKTVNLMQVSKGLSFDGVNDYVNVGAKSSLKVSTAITIEAWINPTGTGTGSNPSWGGIIVNKEGEYEVARFSDGTIQWAFANSNPGWVWINTGYVAPLNQWTHIAVTYDLGLIKTYANGVLVHIYNGSGTIGDYHLDRNDFRIGGRQGGSQFFQGSIDDVRVWNQARNQTEIQADLNRELTGKETGLIGYWNFNAVNSNTVQDLTNNKNNGTVFEAQSVTGVVPTSLIINDNIYEPTETVNLTLSNPTGGATLGTQQTATLTIIDNDAVPGVIQFSNGTYSINENGTPVTAVTLTRSNGSDGTVSVSLTPSNGTATAPSDYNNTAITVNFANGETSKTVTIPIVNDTQFEPNETVNLTLSNPTGGATLGNQKTAVLSIIDNDKLVLLADNFNTENGGVGQLNYTGLANWNVTEGSIDLLGNGFYATFAGHGLFLNLDGSTNNAVRLESKQTFNFNANQVVNLSFAVAGDIDTNPFIVSLGNFFNETFTIPANQPFTTINRSFVVPSTQNGKLIIDHNGGDNYGVHFDDFQLSVSSNFENNNPGFLVFSQPTFKVNEDGIPITAVTVNRINGNLGSVSVTINLSNSTATPGSDYNNSPITLNFADRETSKIVTVPIIDDSIYEPTENINLTLINPTGGATLGTQKTAILRILDNDPTNNIVLLKDDFNTENGGIGKLNYTSLANWNVARGSIDLIGNSFHVNVPEQGLFLDLDGSTLNAGRIESKQTFNFNANQVVTLNFTVSGNFVPGNSANNSFTASLGDLFNETFTVPANQPFTTFTRSFVVPLTETGKLIIDHAGGDNYGAFIDDIELSVSAMLGTIQFNNSTYSINENGTPVTAVTLTRSNGSDGAVSVRINLTNGT
ncbi:MAG: Calx-beta domain-containing protein, partial [Nostocales cyanobacterium LE14-WE4]|nr:Calx-beta domain-containing protein [Nostocales cyanobacterium LE14-WE4]